MISSRNAGHRMQAAVVAGVVLAACCRFAFGLTPELPAGPPVARPNVLFLFTDDQRFDTIAALGHPGVHTPNLDRLARSGVAFTRAYTMGGSSPAVCSPSRACLLTGRSLWNLPNQGEWSYEIPREFTTLPEMFRAAGYRTFATGKNEPGRSGHFARAYGAAENVLFRGMTSSQFVLPLHSFAPDGDYAKQKPVVREGTHSAEIYAASCIDFLKSQAGKAEPFYAYVSFQTPHDPWQSPPAFRERYRDEEMRLPASFAPVHPFDNGMLKIRDEMLAPFPRTAEAVRKRLADYRASITHTDAQVGRILDALEELDLKKDTIIVFSSDNGLALGSHGLMGKQNVYDPSVHVPMILAGPGIPVNGRHDQLCYLYDIHPTLLELAGLRIPAVVEFKSLLPVLKNPAAGHREHLYFAFMSWQRAVQDGRHKLIEYCVAGKRTTQLFDLRADPDEMRNLAGDPANEATLQRLRKLLESERKRLNDGNTPYPFTDRQGKEFWQGYEAGREKPGGG